MTLIMFINIPDIPCPVEKQIIIFFGKKLVKPKKSLLQKASTKPRIKIIQSEVQYSKTEFNTKF